MPKLLSLALAIVLGLTFYVVVQTAFFEKSLTHGFLADALERKQKYAEQHPPPRIIIVGGSNVFYSYRCEAIEALVNRPCVNMGTSAELGLSYSLELLSRIAMPGDTVILSFEYITYIKGKDFHDSGLSHPIRLTRDTESIFELPILAALKSIFAFGNTYTIEALVEMALERMGFERRLTINDINEQGDIVGRSDSLAAQHEPQIEELNFDLERGMGPFQVTNDATAAYTAFVQQSRQKNIQIIATLPTIFEGAGVTSDVVGRIQAVFASIEVPLVVQSNNHVYPRSCFFDTHYHLRESCQILHSIGFARALRPYLE